VATQAHVEVSYGPLALELLQRGKSAPEVLAELLAADPLRSARQVAIVDADGAVAAHTGDSCMPFAGDCQGEGVSCQANIMASGTVWPAMLEAFRTGADRPLAERLMAALHAAEAQGGDIRGRQSAAILVVPGSGNPWDTLVSLRVEDHPEPLDELSRLMRLDRAYALAGAGDECVAAGRHTEAAGLFLRASELAPESHELQFWAGIGAASVGDMDAALAHVRAAIAIQPGWLDLLPRLPPEVAPAAGAVLERLQQSA
jgi:uncharacterized Ntn-hydrolase superfamily protein